MYVGNRNFLTGKKKNIMKKFLMNIRLFKNNTTPCFAQQNPIQNNEDKWLRIKKPH